MSSQKRYKSHLASRSGGSVTIAILLVLVLIPLLAHTVLGFQVSPIPDESMSPALKPGQLMVTIGSQASSLHKGDIIVVPASAGKALVAHRIVLVREISDEIQIATKADNSSTLDQRFAQFERTDMVPRKVALLPFVGSPVKIVATHRVLTIPFLLFFLLLTISALKSLAKRPKKPTFSRPPTAPGIVQVPRLDDPLNHFSQLSTRI
ncbi:MAG: S26 family signal peptidase [Actinomycetes bacterium]